MKLLHLFSPSPLKAILGLVLLLNTGFITQAQPPSCDSVYIFAEQKANFTTDANGLLNYLRLEIAPIISHCVQQDGEKISNLKIRLIIDSMGNVAEAEFPNANITEDCRAKLRQKLLSMKGWIPAKHEGKAVCSYVLCPINCLKWTK